MLISLISSTVKALATIKEKLKQKGFNELNLEVFIGNSHAISFYEKLGYKKIGKVDFPMETNVYKNWVMNKRFD